MTDEERRQKLCEALRRAANPDRSINMPLCGIAADEIERLVKERDEAIKSSDAVCDSYAKENQRLSDKIERLDAENRKLKKNLHHRPGRTMMLEKIRLVLLVPLIFLIFAGCAP